MRVFKDFVQAKNEIARDLNELGVEIFAGYQSRDIASMDATTRDALTTKELQNYGYVVIQPSMDDLLPVQPWANAEWRDRLDGIEGYPTNPGGAWESRKDVWQPLLDGRGKFSYTYSERLSKARVMVVLQKIRENPATRQAYISIWDNMVDPDRIGVQRVPCSLGYHVLVRNDRVELTYHMRSSDFQTHWDNDVWLALQLQQWFAQKLGLEVGKFTHVLGSLHVYKAMVAHVF